MDVLITLSDTALVQALILKKILYNKAQHCRSIIEAMLMNGLACLGYMSDGDLLCGAGAGHDVSFEDHLDGYMSEGGAGLYGRKPPILTQGRGGGRSLPLPSTDDR